MKKRHPQPKITIRPHIPTERQIDETLAASFPASDPPSWTLGLEGASSEPEEPATEISKAAPREFAFA
jgi:hypothetical protein